MASEIFYQLSGGASFDKKKHKKSKLPTSATTEPVASLAVGSKRKRDVAQPNDVDADASDDDRLDVEEEEEEDSDDTTSKAAVARRKRTKRAKTHAATDAARELATAERVCLVDLDIDWFRRHRLIHRTRRTPNSECNIASTSKAPILPRSWSTSPNSRATSTPQRIHVPSKTEREREPSVCVLIAARSGTDSVLWHRRHSSIISAMSCSLCSRPRFRCKRYPCCSRVVRCWRARRPAPARRRPSLCRYLRRSRRSTPTRQATFER